MESNTAVMIELMVYLADKLVGSGYVIHWNGENFEPNLFDLDGHELKPDWYTIMPTKQYLIVINRTIQ
jgi:hypothetical protein